jgi:hypothetical protein
MPWISPPWAVAVECLMVLQLSVGCSFRLVLSSLFVGKKNVGFTIRNVVDKINGQFFLKYSMSEKPIK